MLQLVTVVVVVLFVIPGLLYWAASVARRRIGRAPGWISRPVGRKTTSGMTEPEPPGKS